MTLTSRPTVSIKTKKNKPGIACCKHAEVDSPDLTVPADGQLGVSERKWIRIGKIPEFRSEKSEGQDRFH